MMCLAVCLGTPPSFTGVSWNTGFLLSPQSLAGFEGVWMIKPGDKVLKGGKATRHLHHRKDVTSRHRALSVTAELPLRWGPCLHFPYTVLILKVTFPNQAAQLHKGKLNLNTSWLGMVLHGHFMAIFCFNYMNTPIEYGHFMAPHSLGNSFCILSSTARTAKQWPWSCKHSQSIGATDVQLLPRLSRLAGACEQSWWRRFETQPWSTEKNAFCFVAAAHWPIMMHLCLSKWKQVLEQGVFEDLQMVSSPFCCCSVCREPTARMCLYKYICYSKQPKAICCTQGPCVDSALCLGGFVPPCKFKDVNLGRTRTLFLYICWPEASHAKMY